MRRISFTFVALIVMFSMATAVTAAEYIVKKGDTLSAIASKTGHRAKDLANLNEIDNPDRIIPGQRISYVSELDLAQALAWAKKRRGELHHSDQNWFYFGWVVEDIEAGKIRYSIFEFPGTHASTLLVFSAAWEKYNNRK